MEILTVTFKNATIMPTGEWDAFGKHYKTVQIQGFNENNRCVFWLDAYVDEDGNVIDLDKCAGSGDV
jgi:hypothetical protein